MGALTEYRNARRDEEVARLRRVLALRAMTADGTPQRQVAEVLGVSQPAVSQQLRAGGDLSAVHPAALLAAAAPVLRALAAEHGYSRLSVFGSVARGEARADSDIDLIVEAPQETSTLEFVLFKQLIERVLGREVDLIEFGGLKPRIDDDIMSEAVEL